ncbi:MAG: FHA domain-containing protein [Anaerolineae bacterium]|jgi:pSer/pThr/pTyr-binding forkhead associated (FHA) protein|nr:FHA domain-containing protein [Anaerolineae bacterium]MBT3711820.1 FHA domain-containing protein [Anaerolineae bacterium]MBT4312332.1 FHA domain-containing protein [Anaerolineae bacterium]MBT4457354.1 FHA domain-containing protein [Anaerolineae bacterium]MBT4842897.1 FHA domain-containing protein [Anaerolineae bacterium]
MIMCPACQHQEVEGALFCSDCGAQLQNVASLVTQNIQTNDISREALDAIPQEQKKVLASGSLTLQLLEGGQILPLADRNEFTMGRASEGQTVMPDIDFTPYRAYEYGVSRIHAVLKKTKDKVIVMDLGSSNGTYVNGVRLAPENEYPLSHGNIISLGKLKIQFLLQN